MTEHTDLQNNGSKLSPNDGFSLVVDGRIKTYHPKAESALKQAVALKRQFPLLQITVRDNSTGVRKTVEMDDAGAT